MKRTVLAIALTAAIMAMSLQPGTAQDNKYMQAMEKNVATLDSASTPAGFQELGNTFTRIADAEKDQWLPYYYAAYSHVMQAFMNEKDKDMVRQHADEAEKLIDKADELNPENAEILCVKSLVMSSRISLNPAVNGPIYGPQSGELLQKAIQLTPENPRPQLLMGQSLFYTPEMFGGGKDKAKPFLEKSLEKFKTFQPESSIHPHWGKQLAEELLKQTDK